MFFILKFVLIILINKTYAKIMQDTEKILLPAWNPTNAKEIPLTLKVFGKQIRLNLRRNDQIVPSTFKVWKHDAKGITEDLSQLNALDPCYYLHKDHISSATINLCQKHGWEGFVFLKDNALEIRPLRKDASLSLTDDFCVKEERNQEINISFGKPHLIKRSFQLSADSSFHNSDNFKLKRRHVRNAQEKLTIELAVFFDEAAYRTFMPFLNDDEKMLHMLILAYVNHIQVMFHHSSLAVSIDISLVYLEIMKKQPTNLPVFGGHNEQLLDSFCNYAETRNPPDDNDPRHWDIGLYLTGINIFEAEENGSHILGVSYLNGCCNLNQSCAAVEFGVADYLTSGLSSSLTAAHEIGHLLGMNHDLELCGTYQFILSSGRYYQDQITWSECSRNIALELWYTKECLRDRTRPEHLDDALDHLHYHNLPGRQWTAKAQCEIYFRDKDANVVSLLDICRTLQCETPHKEKKYFTGPALEGTYCAPGKECRGGKCVPVLQPPLEYCENDNWSEWKEDTCRSSCLEESKGVRVKRRTCRHESRSTASCKGPYYDVVLCNNSMLCTENRIKISDFATTKCIEASNTSVQNIKFKVEQPGLQVAYYVKEPWQACTIYCQENDYVVRPLFLLKSDFDPYFPDGTWCHYEGGRNYYCRQHYCLPEN